MNYFLPLLFFPVLAHSGSNADNTFNTLASFILQKLVAAN